MIQQTVTLTMWDSLRTFMSADYASSMPAFGDIAIIVAALMCAFSILKIASDYIQGQTSSNFWEVIRPMVILVVVLEFNTLLLRPFSSLVGILSRDMASACGSVGADYWKEMELNSINLAALEKEHINNDYEEAAQQLRDDTSRIGRFLMKVRIWLRKVLMHFLNVTTMSIGTILGGALFLMAKVLLFVQQMLAALYITILGIVGPVIFALAILPVFEGGIKSWISRYLQISLWIPVGYLVMAINLAICTSIVRSAQAGGGSLGIQWLMVANQIVTIVSISSVPKICAWIVESTGANDAHASLSQPARTFSRRLFRM